MCARCAGVRGHVVGRMLIGCLAGVVIATAAPSLARAATAHVETKVIPPSDPKTGTPTTESTVAYEASPGEQNNVALALRRENSADSVVISDPGNAIAPGFGCSSELPDRVRCSGPGELAGVRAKAGDEDDVFTPGDVALIVDLGPGDDRVMATNAGLGANGDDGADVLACSDREYAYCGLDGGPGGDQLTAGSRGSQMTGGPGADRVVGGSGNDDIKDGDDELDHDVLVGGAGDDSLSYEKDTAGVRVNLSTSAPSGRRDEADQISGFESAMGGSGPDVLIGNDQANGLTGGRGRDRIEGRGGNDGLGAGDIAKDSEGNRLSGGAGNDSLLGAARSDILDGGPGDDELEGEAGADRLLGGPGADRLNGGSGRDRYDAGAGPDLVQPGGLQAKAGSIECGRGRDTLQDPGPRDLVGASCELITWLPEFVFGPRRVRGGTVIFRFKCSTYFAEGRRCRGRIVLISHRRIVAAKSYAMRRGRWRWLRLRLSRGSSRALRSRGRLPLAVHGRSDKRYGYITYRMIVRR